MLSNRGCCVTEQGAPVDVAEWAGFKRDSGEQAVKTTTVLTIDLPEDLGDRLRRVLRQRPGRLLRDITIEALEEWLERHSAEAEQEAAPSGPPSD